jgi:demethylmenaquinone methyltransferase / 2-methoxy-6-polyprenyl-1,4-benzoquinol methylase
LAVSLTLPADEAPRGGSGEMFDRIARRYDLLNRLLSLGLDQSWRRRTIDALGLSPAGRLLDVATGTADVAILAARRVPGLTVVGVDPSRAMLAIGREKVERAGLSGNVTLAEGNALALPFPLAAFDAVTIAFGIRNVADRGAAVREMARVTRPGGRIGVLELIEPRGRPWSAPARLWVRRGVPIVGAILSGAWEYRYLQRSIAAFPPPDEFLGVMAGAGLAAVSSRPMAFGSCCLFVGRVPERRP